MDIMEEFDDSRYSTGVIPGIIMDENRGHGDACSKIRRGHYRGHCPEQIPVFFAPSFHACTRQSAHEAGTLTRKDRATVKDVFRP